MAKSQESPEHKHTEYNDKHLSLMDHFMDLRRKIMIILLWFVVSSIIGYIFADNIFEILRYPLANAHNLTGYKHVMIATGLSETFVTYIKIALWFGLFATFPLFIINTWLFLSPALYKYEKLAILPFIILSPVLFVLGACFSYFIVIPRAWNFFLSFEKLPSSNSLPIILQAKVDQYLSLIMHLITIFGMGFELPIFLLFLVKFNVVSIGNLKKFRKFAILISFIISAIVTPPDIISQCLLAIPLILLYESSIIIGRFIIRPLNKTSQNAYENGKTPQQPTIISHHNFMDTDFNT